MKKANELAHRWRRRHCSKQLANAQNVSQTLFYFKLRIRLKCEKRKEKKWAHERIEMATERKNRLN